MFRCAFFIGILLQVCILFGDFQKVEDQSSLRILSPDFKDYQVVKGILNNQLKVLIISDPKAIESAAALSVEVGSWEDPKQYPGMAHFVEHMLFLGTKKFPEENQYAHFINEHGGNQNAYTSQDHTVYIYSIDNAYFQQSLERFADFFIQPIFSKSGLERERLAVHSEHMRNLENDAYRFYYLTKTLTDKSHPYSQFSTGSKFTLQDVGTKELFNWFNQYYSSQIMQLVVYSSQSVDMLIDWVEKNFSNIPNSLVKYPEYTGRMIKKNQQPTVVYLDPVKDQQTLRLRWAIPAKFTSEKQRFIVDTASFILGHEGEGSLLSTLKKAKLAESIGVGSYIYREEGVLEMYLRLTTQGLEHVDAVIERIYQAIERLKQEAVPDYLPQEIYQMNLQQFQFPKRKDSYALVNQVIEQLRDDDFKTYPHYILGSSSINQQAFTSFMKSLTPDDMQVFIIASPKKTQIEYLDKDKITGAAYAMRPIERKVLDKWKKAALDPQIVYPNKNSYLPTDFTIKHSEHPRDTILPIPKCIMDDAFGKLYFQADEDFSLPHINLKVSVKTPLAQTISVKNQVLKDLYLMLVKDELKELLYQGKMAGCSIGLNLDDQFYLQLYGYNDKAYAFLKDFLMALKQVKVKENKFKAHLFLLKQRLQAYSKGDLLNENREIYTSIIYKKFISTQDKLSIIDQVTVEDLKVFSKYLFQQTYLEGLIFGNITSQESIQIKELLSNHFKHKTFPLSDQRERQCIILNKHSGPFLVSIATQSFGSLSSLIIQETYENLEDKLIGKILSRVIEPNFFDELRTKQQTGYLVGSNFFEIEKKLFQLFIVESSIYSSRDLLHRFEHFLENFIQEFDEKVNPKLFNDIKEVMKREYQDLVDNSDNMTRMLFNYAFKEKGDFLIPNKCLDLLETLSLATFKEKSLAILSKTNKQRVAILLQGNLEEGSLRYNPYTVQDLKSISNFSSLEDKKE